MIDMLKSVNPNPAPHELDLLMACGEIISSTVMAATLQERGLKAKASPGPAGMITDDEYGNARSAP